MSHAVRLALLRPLVARRCPLTRGKARACAACCCPVNPRSNLRKRREGAVYAGRLSPAAAHSTQGQKRACSGKAPCAPAPRCPPMPPTRSLAQAGGGVGPRAPAPVLAAASGPKPSMSEQEGRTRCAGRLPPAAAHSTQGRTRGSGGDAASAGRLPPAAASDSRTSVSGRRLRIVSATPSLPAAASDPKSSVSEREVRTICAGRLPPAAAHWTQGQT